MDFSIFKKTDLNTRFEIAQIEKCKVNLDGIVTPLEEWVKYNIPIHITHIEHNKGSCVEARDPRNQYTY
jgi:hypothetical protein